MSRRTIWWTITGVVVIATVVVLGRMISGGEETFRRVAETLKSHPYVVERVGSPISDIRENGGPSEVALSSDGRRSGHYSIDVEGPRGSARLKVYWRERATKVVEIDAIFTTKPWKQDELVWGRVRF